MSPPQVKAREPRVDQPILPQDPESKQDLNGVKRAIRWFQNENTPSLHKIAVVVGVYLALHVVSRLAGLALLPLAAAVVVVGGVCAYVCAKDFFSAKKPPATPEDKPVSTEEKPKAPEFEPEETDGEPVSPKAEVKPALPKAEPAKAVNAVERLHEEFMGVFGGRQAFVGLPQYLKSNASITRGWQDDREFVCLKLNKNGSTRVVEVRFTLGYGEDYWRIVSNSVESPFGSPYLTEEISIAILGRLRKIIGGQDKEYRLCGS